MTKTLTPSMTARPHLEVGHHRAPDEANISLREVASRPGARCGGDASAKDRDTADQSADALVELGEELREIGDQVLHLPRDGGRDEEYDADQRRQRQRHRRGERERTRHAAAAGENQRGPGDRRRG